MCLLNPRPTCICELRPGLRTTSSKTRSPSPTTNSACLILEACARPRPAANAEILRQRRRLEKCDMQRMRRSKEHPGQRHVFLEASKRRCMGTFTLRGSKRVLRLAFRHLVVLGLAQLPLNRAGNIGMTFPGSSADERGGVH